MVNIGQEIKKRAKEMRIGATELATLISTSRQNVYGIFGRKSLDTRLLEKFAVALEYNFFRLYTHLDQGKEYEMEQSEALQAKDVEIEYLKKENAELKNKIIMVYEEKDKVLKDAQKIKDSQRFGNWRIGNEDENENENV